MQKKYILAIKIIAALIAIYFMSLFFQINSTLYSLVIKVNNLQANSINEPSICVLNENYKSDNIIFVETNAKREKLTFKESCAVESAAKNNPELKIKLFSVNAKIDNLVLNNYPNIYFLLTDMNVLFKDSLLENWWKSDVLSKDTYFRESHLSDALRFLLTYTYGGFYSDLDTITVKNLSPLRKYAGVGVFEHTHYEIGSGFMHFPKHHPFLLYILQRFEKNYNPKVWGANGPILIQKMLAEYCNTTDRSGLLIKKDEIFYKKVKNKIKECDVSLYPREFVYPYLAENSDKLFKPNSVINIREFIYAFSIHFYNKESSKYEVEKNQYTIYEQFAFSNCPLSYRYYLNNN